MAPGIGGAKPLPVLLAARELGIGGCERDLTRTALGLDPSLFAPHVVCFHSEGPRGDELRQAGVPIVRLPVSGFASFGAVRAARLLGEYLRCHEIQLVQSFDVPLTIFSVPVARLYRTPVVIASQLGFRQLFPPSLRHLLRTTDQMADRIVVNCEALRRHMNEDERIPAKKIFVCHNGVDPSVFYRAEEPRPAALADASLVIGTVCALRPEKRVDLLMEAFARVRWNDPGMRLAIVGSGPELPALERHRDDLGLGSACVFVPTTIDVARWMRAMDVFVLASTSEGFPNALLEALASGCCVVASSVGGVPELVAHEQNGLLFTRDDLEELVCRLNAAVADRGLRRRLGSEGARTARERFSTQIYMERIQKLYGELLRQNCGR